MDLTIHIVNFTSIQESILHNIPNDYLITIMRRMMYRISEKLMEKNNLLCLINGESVGQVASQTLTSMRVINAVTNKPVIRPVACLDKLEIIDISKKIGTYETSILPYEDCCTIFLPKHPVINPDIDKGVVEPIQNGEYKKAIRNLFSSMTQSAPASAARRPRAWAGSSTPSRACSACARTCTTRGRRRWSSRRSPIGRSPAPASSGSTAACSASARCSRGWRPAISTHARGRACSTVR